MKSIGNRDLTLEAIKQMKKNHSGFLQVVLVFSPLMHRGFVEAIRT